MTGLLEGKVAIVTGGTSGIGLASAELFLAQGAKVAVADIQDDLGAALEAKHAESFAYIHTDVTDEASIEALVAATVERFGALDVIFNNAGAAGDPAPILELGSEGFDKTIALLTRSVLLGHSTPRGSSRHRAQAARSSRRRAPQACRGAGGPPPTRSPSTPWSASCTRRRPSSPLSGSAPTRSPPASS